MVLINIFFDRSSEKFNKRLTIFSKRDVLETRCFKKFCKIHKKTTVPESNFLIKLQVSACKLIKKETLSRRCFPANFAKFLKIPFFKKHVRWLLLECTSVWGSPCLPWLVSYLRNPPHNTNGFYLKWFYILTVNILI